MSHPITVQPGVAEPVGMPEMQVQQSMPGCPPGLQYLIQVDQVLCKQLVEVMQEITGWDTKNRYEIKNSMGQRIYYAHEESSACMRYCCGSERGFVIHIVDNANQEVIRVNRPFKLCAGCCWCAGACNCCANEITVEAPPGTVIGHVHQSGACCSYNFNIQDADKNTVLKIDGPCLTCRCCCRDVKFPVYTADGRNKVGMVAKQFSGLAKEMLTEADNFGIEFPLDLDVRIKATLLATTFLIDFMAFEHKNVGDEERR